MKGQLGRPLYDTVLMFKILTLQTLYSLSVNIFPRLKAGDFRGAQAPFQFSLQQRADALPPRAQTPCSDARY